MYTINTVLGAYSHSNFITNTKIFVSIATALHRNHFPLASPLSLECDQILSIACSKQFKRYICVHALIWYSIIICLGDSQFSIYKNRIKFYEWNDVIHVVFTARKHRKCTCIVFVYTHNNLRMILTHPHTRIYEQ